jgi:hypothetical protein
MLWVEMPKRGLVLMVSPEGKVVQVRVLANRGMLQQEMNCRSTSGHVRRQLLRLDAQRARLCR